MSSAHVLLLITFNIIGIRHVASVNEQLMKKFASNCTDLDHPEKCVYEMMGNAYSQGYNFTEEEMQSVEEDLKRTECMDLNDTKIEGCTPSGTVTGLRFGNEDKVKFILWTSEGKILDFNANHKFNGKNPTYFIFHGFFSRGSIDWIKQAKDGILQTKSSANVISVDWESSASVFSSYVLWSYCTAVNNIKSVAEHTSELIHSLIRTKGLQTSNLHLVGHSLGAHAAGITAQFLYSTDNSILPISTITGLDPAGPLFFNRNSSEKLSRDDATYVQVIHTNGGTDTRVIRALVTGTFGYFPPLGDDDFYPNGGEDQPGCAWNWFCAHGRSYNYWIESIEATSVGDIGGINPAAPPNPVFIASTCNTLENLKVGSCDRCSSNCVTMGYFLKAPRGSKDLNERVHYLKTNSEAPFAKDNIEAILAKESTDIMPIVLGISLAVIIVIVLIIACVLGRKRCSGSYRSV